MDIKEKSKRELHKIVCDLQNSDDTKYAVLFGLFYTFLECEDEDRIHKAFMDEFWEYDQRDTGVRILGKTNKN